jgi:hypothetical protein
MERESSLNDRANSQKDDVTTKPYRLQDMLKQIETLVEKTKTESDAPDTQAIDPTYS